MESGKKVYPLRAEQTTQNQMRYGDCRFNEGVVCGWQVRCDKCGWNPSVAEQRKIKRMEGEYNRAKKER